MAQDTPWLSHMSTPALPPQRYAGLLVLAAATDESFPAQPICLRWRRRVDPF